MDRLTIMFNGEWAPKELCTIDRFGEVDDCSACSEECADDCSTCPVQKCFNQLAAYEDTGLSPERCAELAKADQEGRLVELPIDIDDYVHIVTGSKCELRKVCEIRKSSYGYWEFCVAEWHTRYFMFDDIGKTVFLTHEEAEKALEREGE